MVHFKLVTLSGVKFDGEAYEVILPTLDGQIAVLTDHMPLVSVATTGVISVRRSSRDPDYQMESFAANGGVIEVENNELTVLVDEANHSAEINETEAQKAYERAQKMKSEAKDAISLEHAQTQIDRHAVRLKVAQLHRRHGSRNRQQ
jgi:F-type H+-transporting ATPase subunit epsilon